MKHGKRKRKKGSPRASRAPGTSRPPAETSSATRTARSAASPEGSASGPPVEPWWEREVGRLEFELEQLNEAGIKYEVDEAAKARGLLLIHLEVIIENSKPIHLQALFPDLYPYFRFEIRASELDLPYHQHPFSKQLCVLGRATENWRPSDTLAKFIKERVPKVLASSQMTSRTDAGGIEEHQGEPFSDYYAYFDNSIILIDGGWNLGAVDSGSLLIGLPQARRRGLELRGAVLEIRDLNNRLIADAAPEILRLFPQQINGRWVRVQEPIHADRPELFLAELCKLDKRFEQEHWQSIDGYRYDVVGVVFPEEHRWRSVKADGWVFVTRAMPIGGTGNRDRYVYLARVGRTGKSDLIERTPELAGLNAKRVAVIGAGAIGAPSCIELARCGLGELRILDYDFVDPATTARWPLGIAAAGVLKAEALRDFLAANYPYTDVHYQKHRIGMCQGSDEATSEIEILRGFIEGVDLIYDASAEIGINHLLSDMAAEKQIPYIAASTTYGAWGGRLIRVRPDITKGCWMCYFAAVQSGLLPLPPSDPNGEVQPAGCADPTFTGTGFDVGEIALAGVRLAVGTLQTSTVGYPNVDWDVAIISLRDSDGRVSNPHWEVFPLDRHPECRNFRAHCWTSVGSSRGLAAANGRGPASGS